MALGTIFLWGSLTSAHWFCAIFFEKLLKARDAAEWTCPFWARVGSGRIRLSRTFRGPFASLSRISRRKKAIPETHVYARVTFIICANQGATANFQNMGHYETETCSYPSTNKSVCLHHSIHISVKVLYTYKYIQYTAPITDPVAILQLNCQHEYYDIYVDN